MLIMVCKFEKQVFKLGNLKVFGFEKPKFRFGETTSKVSAGIKKCHDHKFIKQVFKPGNASFQLGIKIVFDCNKQEMRGNV